MSIIKIEDIAHVRFSAPDLDVMQAFLEDFGLVKVEHEGDELFVRGRGTQPFVHSTVKGEPGFKAIGFQATDLGALETLAKAEGVSVEPFQGPGGGSLVALTDPNGYRVEVIAGQKRVEPLTLERRIGWNDAEMKDRLREALRLTPAPAQVVRLGHAVLEVKDFRESEAWYKARFGFVTSDEIEAAPDFTIGAFLRCDRGDQPTDHHTLFLLQGGGEPRFNHAAFEVVDLDDLMVGHTHLKNAKRDSAWGVGRHILGSQVFDYWRDPWGHELEHWTDGDLFNVADGSNKATLDDLLGVQWGPLHPMTQGASE